jgi:hypothetical protein
MKWMIAVTGVLIVGGIVSVVPVRADSDIPALPKPDYPVKFDVRGFQNNSSSPFLVYIDGLGPGVWQRLVGPVLSSPITIPPATGFGGASCQLEYSQNQIVIEDGSALTLDVHGIRCEDAVSPGAHTTTGNYSIVAGTGRFTYPRGTGTVSIQTRPDGISFITITGGCYQGMCGVFLPH